MNVQLLQDADIFDTYGCEFLIKFKPLADDDLVEVESRLREIQATYVHTTKARIRAEAKFLGVPIDVEESFEQMLSRVRDILAARLMRPPMPGPRSGGLMGDILAAHHSAGADVSDIGARFGVGKAAVAPPKPDVDPEWFLKRKRGSTVFDDPKWHEIAKAFVRMEQAREPAEIAGAIDALNALQHNSFHLLIDLQCGRMLTQFTGENAGDYESSRRNLQTVLDIVKNEKYPHDYADKMSKPIRKLLHRYGR